MVRRALRLIVTVVLSIMVAAGVAWGALALWFDGPSSRLLAGTMRGDGFHQSALGPRGWLLMFYHGHDHPRPVTAKSSGALKSG
jgi:hypothetical protein